MSLTKISSNVLAPNAAENNLNEETIITLTKPVSITGNISASGDIYGSNLIYNTGNNNNSNITIGTNDNYNLNLGTGGVTRMSILSSGGINLTPATNTNIALNTGGNGYVQVVGGNGIACSTYNSFGPNKLKISSGGSAIYLNSANGVVEVGNDSASTLSRAINIYNTYTNASNYERGFLRWIGNEFTIGAEKAGTGVNRNVKISGGDGANNHLFISTDTIGFRWGGETSNRWEISDGGFFSASPSLATRKITFRTGGFICFGHFEANTFAIATSHNGTAASALERFRITPVGNVGIGTLAPASKLTVENGDVEVTSIASGIILKSPNGTRFRITVNDDGSLQTTAI